MTQESGHGRRLHFVCPKCGSEDTLCGEYLASLEVEEVYEDGTWEASDPNDHSEDVTFCCGDCGYDLVDEEGNKVAASTLVKWLKTHCNQDDFESEPDE